MARSRNVKPGYFTNEDLADCGIYAHLLFAGLWTIADRKGRLEDRPRRIKIQLMPFYDVTVEELLLALVQRGFIQRYTHAGNNYIQIINFHKHQNPHIKEHDSTIPAPDLHCACTGISSISPADSLNPLTDSLTTTLSDKSDVSPLANKKNGLQQEAKDILLFLNEKTGKNYQPVKANIELIVARLHEGFTTVQLRQVIAKKCREWKPDEKMVGYLRPKTLFNRSNFANDPGELVDAVS